MTDRRRLARESLEIYLVHLIMAYRRLILFIGLFLLLYSISMMFINPMAGAVILLPAIYFLFLCSSFTVVLYTARLGAWLGTMRKTED